MTLRRIALVAAVLVVIGFLGLVVNFSVQSSRYQTEYRSALAQIDQHLLKCPSGLDANGWQSLVGTTSSTIVQTSGFNHSSLWVKPPLNRSTYEQLHALNLDLQTYLTGKEALTEEDVQWLYDRVSKTSSPAQAFADKYRVIFEGELRAVFHPTEPELLARDVMAELNLEVRGIESKLKALSERPPPGVRVPAWKALIGSTRRVLSRAGGYLPMSYPEVCSLHRDLNIRISSKPSLNEEDIRWIYDRMATADSRAEEYANEYRFEFEDPLRWVFHPQAGDQAELDRRDQYLLTYHAVNTQFQLIAQFQPPNTNGVAWNLLVNRIRKALIQAGGAQQTTCDELQAFHRDLKQKRSEKRFQGEADIRWIFDRVAATNPASKQHAKEAQGEFESLLKRAFHSESATSGAGPPRELNQ